MPALLRVESAAKSYAGVHALREANFELLAGEVHALIGENGAGKSTLVKIISGAVTADRGRLLVDGQEVVGNSPALAKTLGIRIIYQQPALFPQLTVAENIALGVESGGLWRKLDWTERRSRAAELLRRVGASIGPEQLVESLSMPEQQLVEIAKAIGTRARVLILDEPTASLSEREVEKLFEVIRSLRAEGVGLVYISHRLEEIATVADRVTVLRDGQTIATRPMAGVDRAELIRLMVGRELSAIFPKRTVPIGDPVLACQDLRCRALGIRGVSFEVRRGEILGLAGLVGAGRTEVARLLFGLARPDGGTITMNGREIRPGSPSEAIACGIAYVPEDRRQHGVIAEMPIAANATLASLAAVAPNGLIDEDREITAAQGWVEQLRVKTPSVFTPAGALSGGNQQKVAIARWLATEPAVIVLDEPTQGVDVGSKSEIHTIMVDLAARGCAVIMISSELPEVLGMSDRIAVMHEGRIAGVLRREEATQEKVLALALGHTEAVQ